MKAFFIWVNMLNNQMEVPAGLSAEEADEFWMQHAYRLAAEAALQGEIGRAHV